MNSIDLSLLLLANLHNRLRFRNLLETLRILNHLHSTCAIGICCPVVPAPDLLTAFVQPQKELRSFLLWPLLVHLHNRQQ